MHTRHSADVYICRSFNECTYDTVLLVIFSATSVVCSLLFSFWLVCWVVRPTRVQHGAVRVLMSLFLSFFFHFLLDSQQLVL